MQSDDRVERLENSLKHMQDRADELEFQLSKLKPVETSHEFFLSVVIDIILIPGAYSFEIRSGRFGG